MDGNVLFALSLTYMKQLFTTVDFVHVWPYLNSFLHICILSWLAPAHEATAEQLRATFSQWNPANTQSIQSYEKAQEKGVTVVKKYTHRVGISRCFFIFELFTKYLKQPFLSNVSWSRCFIKSLLDGRLHIIEMKYLVTQLHKIVFFWSLFYPQG